MISIPMTISSNTQNAIPMSLASRSAVPMSFSTAINQEVALSDEAKEALLNCFAHVAWIDDDGQDYYDALYDALYSTPPATLVSISAVYTQSGTVYTTTSLDDLKTDLVVTATYDDSSTETVTTYTLSGTLEVGTSTVTVSYGGKTTTFNVTVTESPSYVSGMIHHYDAIDNTGSGHDSTATTWKDIVGTNDLTINGTGIEWGTDYLNFTNSPSGSASSANFLKSSINAETAGSKTVEICFIPSESQTSAIIQAFGTGSDERANGNAYGKILMFTDNTVNVRGMSSYTYPTGLTSLTGVKSISASYSGNSAINKVYINGSEVHAGSVTHSLKGSDSKMIVGGSAASGTSATYTFKGKIYSIRIYDKILTDAEVANNYSVDVARFNL